MTKKEKMWVWKFTISPNRMQFAILNFWRGFAGHHELKHEAIIPILLLLPLRHILQSTNLLDTCLNLFCFLRW